MIVVGWFDWVVGYGRMREGFACLWVVIEI